MVNDSQKNSVDSPQITSFLLLTLLSLTFQKIIFESYFKNIFFLKGHYARNVEEIA